MLAAGVARLFALDAAVAGPPPEQGLRALDDPVVVDLPGGRQDHPVRRIGPVHVICDRPARHAADHVRAAEHRAAERLLRIGDGLEIVEDEVVGRVVGLTDLLQHDGALAAQLFLVEGGVQKNVRDQIEREIDILLQHLRVVDRAFAPGVGVEVAADRLDLLRDVGGAAGRRPLEGHMLQQMRDPVHLRRLVPRSGSDPHADRSSLHGRHVMGDDADPVIQRGEPAVHAAPRRPTCWRMKPLTADRSFGKTVMRSSRS